MIVAQSSYEKSTMQFSTSERLVKRGRLLKIAARKVFLTYFSLEQAKRYSYSAHFHVLGRPLRSGRTRLHLLVWKIKHTFLGLNLFLQRMFLRSGWGSINYLNNGLSLNVAFSYASLLSLTISSQVMIIDWLWAPIVQKSMSSCPIEVPSFPIFYNV